jgi:hypothetical protein
LLKTKLNNQNFAQASNSFEQLLTIINMAHYINNDTEPRPGPGDTIQLIRSTLDLTDAEFTLRFPGVPRYMKAYEIRTAFLNLFESMDEHQKSHKKYTKDRLDVPYSELKGIFAKNESSDNKPHRAFAANDQDQEHETANLARATNGNDLESSYYAPSTSSKAAVTSEQQARCQMMPCEICTNNTMLDAKIASNHNALHCYAVGKILNNPSAARDKGYKKSFQSMNLPDVKTLYDLQEPYLRSKTGKERHDSNQKTTRERSRSRDRDSSRGNGRGDRNRSSSRDRDRGRNDRGSDRNRSQSRDRDAAGRNNDRKSDRSNNRNREDRDRSRSKSNDRSSSSISKETKSEMQQVMIDLFNSTATQQGMKKLIRSTVDEVLAEPSNK